MNEHKYETNKCFYVFYDKNDFVTCFGTAQQLVEDGFFPTKNSVKSRASKIKAKKLKGTVVIMPLVDKEG